MAAPVIVLIVLVQVVAMAAVAGAGWAQMRTRAGHGSAPADEGDRSPEERDRADAEGAEPPVAARAALELAGAPVPAWALLAVALIGVVGVPVGALIAGADESPPDCVEYVDHLAEIDNGLTAKREEAFSKASTYDRASEECGDPLPILRALGGD